MSCNREGNDGFSIIEMMLVVVIVGILVTITVSVFLR